MRFGGLAAIWLATRCLHGVPAASAAGGGLTAGGAIVVKVGDGKYLTVDLTDALSMKSGALLKALKHDETFATTLAGVALDKCAVRVCASVSKKSPAAAEEASARELEGIETLGELAMDLMGVTPAAGTNLFVRVTLPPYPGSMMTAVGGDGECEIAFDRTAQALYARAAPRVPHPTPRMCC